jgi:hypothetical protein
MELKGTLPLTRAPSVLPIKTLDFWFVVHLRAPVIWRGGRSVLRAWTA